MKKIISLALALVLVLVTAVAFAETSVEYESPFGEYYHLADEASMEIESHGAKVFELHFYGGPKTWLKIGYHFTMADPKEFDLLLSDEVGFHADLADLQVVLALEQIEYELLYKGGADYVSFSLLNRMISAVPGFAEQLMYDPVDEVVSFASFAYGGVKRGEVPAWVVASVIHDAVALLGR